ncbi:MAG TPA: hypothetical protein VLC46_17310 [Thermoanaerobaculia bacterium]|jgi:hypothetical protein|nr:hypothetical protein [Thermoanaerobaculia bacterium]
MKMTEFRSRQPLNDDDFAAIRRNVMTTIASRRERRFFPLVMRFALAAAVVIAIGLAFLVRRPAPPAGIAIGKPAIVIPVQPATVVASAAVPQPITPVAHRPRHRRPHSSQNAFALAAQQNIRVEFRTSDPDVRIIWIASQTPTTTGGKS